MTDTYYDLPVVKAPPWGWYIPAYFYTGGVSGAAATLGGALDLLGRSPVLARRLHWIAAIGEATSSVLLIVDLGRPERFVNMFRVFRPTSPMNMGTWILSAATASGGLALLARTRVTAAASGLVGTMLSTYTGVLVGNTAIPVWKAARNQLPVWFAAASAAGLGSLLELGSPSPLVRVYAGIAKVAELVTADRVERAADDAGVGKPLREGRAGAMWRGAKWLRAASLVATLWPSRGRTRGVVAGVLGTASAVLARFALVEAGKASAADPRATFEPQRA